MTPRSVWLLVNDAGKVQRSHVAVSRAGAEAYMRVWGLIGLRPVRYVPAAMTVDSTEGTVVIAERMGEQTKIDWNRRSVRESAIERDKGIHRAAAASGNWQAEAAAVIRNLAFGQPEFTSDDVWRLLGRDAAIEGRALGFALRAAAAARLCEATDRTVRSVRVACHRRPLRVWRSLVYSGQP